MIKKESDIRLLFLMDFYTFFLRYTGKKVTLAVDIFISEMNDVA